MTIYDISEKAGVSIATVSRVLNGSNSVSERTRQKVLDIIEQYGYTPNAFAQGIGPVPGQGRLLYRAEAPCPRLRQPPVLHGL